jgi:hypothetical protein
MGFLEGGGVHVLYIGRTVPKGSMAAPAAEFKWQEVTALLSNTVNDIWL